MNVQLDQFTQRTVPVEIEQGVPPTGLTVGVMDVEPKQVTVEGAKSLVDKVVKATGSRRRSRSPGIDIDQDVDLIPVDSVGNRVSPVDLSPRFVHVTLPVFSDRQSRTLPVKPVITGTPAPGFEVESVTVTPTVVTVEGDADQLSTLVSVNTMPVSINGASSALTTTADLDLPTGVVPIGDTRGVGPGHLPPDDVDADLRGGRPAGRASAPTSTTRSTSTGSSRPSAGRSPTSTASRRRPWSWTSTSPASARAPRRST